MRARVRLLVLLFLCAVVAVCFGNFLLAAMIAIAADGPLALPAGLLLGLLSLAYALLLATLPAMLLGGLLWACQVRRTAIWAGTGALGGLGCYALALVVPGPIGEAAIIFQPNPLDFTPAFAIAGALAALLFRTLMRAFSDYAEALDAD